MFDGGSILDTLIACEMHFTDGLYVPCTLFCFVCERKRKRLRPLMTSCIYYPVQQDRKSVK